MAIRVGINGFGRIGRMVFRAAFGREDIEFVGINDLTSNETLAYLLKYDSVHRGFDGEVSYDDAGITVNGKKIPISEERDPAKIDWRGWGADIVLECTGIFVKRDECAAHLDAGAKFVIISAPGKKSDYTLVYGVNHEGLDLETHKIISNASCTTNCLAPMVKVLDDAFGVEKGLMTTIHSYTNNQSILDSPSRKDLRRGRAAALSMIPTTTGAAKAVGLVLPHLNGKLDGMAVRVPTPNVSLTDLTANLRTETTAEAINEAMRAAANGPLEGIIEYCEDEIVSIDVNGNPHSCIFMPDQTRAYGDLVKVMGWYDNEWGYSCRMIDVVKYIASHLG